MAGDKQEYEFTEDGWFAGTFYRKGQRARFHARQVAHNLHRMTLVVVDAAPAKPARKAKAED